MQWLMDGFRDSVAEYISQNTEPFSGIGVYWDTHGYADDAPGFGLVIDQFMQQDIKQIKLRAYVLDNDTSGGETTINIEFHIRAGSNPDELSRVADGLFELFHDMWSVTIGDTKVVKARWSSESNLGPDGSGRVSQLVTYSFTVHRPSRNRT